MDLIVAHEIAIPLPDDGCLHAGRKEIRLVVVRDLADLPEEWLADPTCQQPAQDRGDWSDETSRSGSRGR